MAQASSQLLRRLERDGHSHRAAPTSKLRRKSSSLRREAAPEAPPAPCLAIAAVAALNPPKRAVPLMTTDQRCRAWRQVPWRRTPRPIARPFRHFRGPVRRREPRPAAYRRARDRRSSTRAGGRARRFLADARWRRRLRRERSVVRKIRRAARSRHGRAAKMLFAGRTNQARLESQAASEWLRQPDAGLRRR